MTGSGQLVYVEAPVATRFSGGIALLGSPSVLWKDSLMYADSAYFVAGGLNDIAGVVLDSRLVAHVVPLPPGVPRLLDPRAERAADGSLHVVWAFNKDSRPSTYQTELWYGRFDGKQWSNVERLLVAKQIYWNTEWQSSMSVVGEPHIAVAVRGSVTTPARTGIAYLQRTRSGWSTSWMSPHKFFVPSNTAVSADARGTVTVAFVGSVDAPPTGSESDGLYVYRSTDRGASWLPVKKLADVGEQLAHSLQLLRVGMDTMHLMWVVDSLPDKNRGSLHHVVSSDAGASWREAASLQLPNTMEALTVAEYGGQQYGILRTQNGFNLSEVVWNGTTPPTLRPLALEPPQSVQRINSIGADSLLLNIGLNLPANTPLRPSSSAPALLISTMTTRCR